MKSITQLKNQAEYYYSLGLNVICAGYRPTLFNCNENNIFKAPNHDISNIRERRQEQKEFESIDWSDSIGIGIVLGHNKIFAIDIDGCTDIEVVRNICKILKLPHDYEWVFLSGSQTGYHIVFQCLDKVEMKNVRRVVVSGESLPEIPFGSVDTNAYFPNESNRNFFKIEFKWGGNLILPNSLHNSGEEYKIHGSLPTKYPENVNFRNVFAVKEYFGSLQCASSEPLNDGYAVTHQFVANGDQIPNNFETSRNEPYVLLEYNSFLVVNSETTLSKLKPHLVQISWAVLDKNLNLTKRKTVNYFKFDHEFNLDKIRIEYHSDYCAWEIDSALCWDEKEIDFDIAKKIVTSKRNAMFELIFDLNHTSEIVVGDLKHLDMIRLDIHTAGLYFDCLIQNVANGPFKVNKKTHLLSISINSSERYIFELYKLFLKQNAIEIHSEILENSEIERILNDAYNMFSFLEEKQVYHSELDFESQNTSFEDFDEDSEYCGACESSPCMCSDREKTSMTHDF